MKEHKTQILEIHPEKNTWTPPLTDEYALVESIANDVNVRQADGFVYVFRTKPYIDSVYVRFDGNGKPSLVKRFAFHEGYVWNFSEERFFDGYCVNNKYCAYNGGAIDEIYSYYSEKYPEWNLKRYYTKGIRLLDHIYHCMKQNTAKELLYKAGLDELAAGVYRHRELNLLARSPTEIYDGLSIKVLRSLNCEYGAMMLNNEKYRLYLKELDAKFPDLLKKGLNDAQCRYLLMLIRGDLTVGETGRLFGARKDSLSHAWTAGYADFFLGQFQIEREAHLKKCAMERMICQFGEIDRIYVKYIKSLKRPEDNIWLKRLHFFLLQNRKEYDKAIIRSNRKRIYEWQERNSDYVVRYPQTINDFCREAIYMQNCLLWYVEAYVCNDTTILFMRKRSDVNTPFISIEIHKNVLMQAYHRYNKDCTEKETEWIKEYCLRHGIRTSSIDGE